MPKLFDTTSFSTRQKTKDGFLIAEAVLARTGIQGYTPSELIAGGVSVPAWLMDRKTIRLNRPAEEVFKDKALSGLNHLPITITHPSEDVAAGNVQDLQVGFTQSPAHRVGDTAVNKIKIQVADAVEAVESGMEELSVGYDTEIVFVKDAQEADKLGYEGTQTDIEPNHVALVDQARGGHNVRIMDTGDRIMVTRLIDGISIELSDQGAQAVDKLQSTIRDAAKAHDKEIAKLKDSASDLQGKLDATKVELEKEKEGRLTDAQIADAVQEKAELIETAKAYLGDSVDPKMSNLEIKKSVVSKVYDSLDLTDRDEAYIFAVFDAAVATAPSASKKLKDGIEKNKTKINDSAETESEFAGRHARKYNGGK